MSIGSQTSRELPGDSLKPAPYEEGRERFKRAAGHCGLVGGVLILAKGTHVHGLSQAGAR